MAKICDLAVSFTHSYQPITSITYTLSNFSNGAPGLWNIETRQTGSGNLYGNVSKTVYIPTPTAGEAGSIITSNYILVGSFFIFVHEPERYWIMWSNFKETFSSMSSPTPSFSMELFDNFPPKIYLPN